MSDQILDFNSYVICVSTGTADIAINQQIQIGQQPILSNKKVYALEIVSSTFITKGKNGNAAITDALLKNLDLVISIVNPNSGQQQQPFDVIPTHSLMPNTNGLQAIRRYNDIVIDYNNTFFRANSALSLSSTSYDISLKVYYR